LVIESSNQYPAAAVSLFMVLAAVIVLVLVRVYGMEAPAVKVK
jgi:hypothetical protein